MTPVSSSHHPSLKMEAQASCASRFSYFAYGLGIQSALPIPEFIPAEAGCDVAIHIDGDRTIFDYVPQEVVEEPLALQVSPEEAVVYLKDAGVFLVRGGREIVVIPAQDASERLIQHSLAGSVMAILLYQRGLFVLHASAVNINGSAVAFLGKSGEGKSSMAAALHLQGCGVIADDVVAVTLDQGPATMFPGFPQIKLYREVADVLGYDRDSLHLLHPQLGKGGYRWTEDFPQTPLPIRRIYVLVSGPELRIEPLRPHEAVVELMSHSELATLFHSRDGPHFQRCAVIAKECAVYRLGRPRDLALLPELARLVSEQVKCDIQ